MKIAGDSGEIVVLASGFCPFCREPIHIVCDTDKVGESVKIVDGRVVDILLKTFAHPEPWCREFERSVKRKGFWKWLWRKGAMKIDPTPLNTAMN